MRFNIRIIAIVLIIVLLGIAAFFWWWNRAPGTTNETTTNTNATEEASGLDVPEVVEVASPPDADADGVSDTDETALGTKIDNADSDADGLSDYDEIRIYTTNPLRADTDQDGFDDGEEVSGGFNPNGNGPLLNTQQAIINAQNQ